MSDHAGALREQLLRPLLLGGPLVPLPPIGRGWKCLTSAALPPELCSAQLRRARTLAAIDELPQPRTGEIRLLCALNDLLQVTHPDLRRSLMRKGPARLLALAHENVLAAGFPATPLELLHRHALLGGALRIVRHDTELSWWVGSRAFAGQLPPERLRAWPSLRRVRETHTTTALPQFAKGCAYEAEWLGTLASWLEASPLTDLASADRTEPSFRWHAALVATLQTALGRTLARRALLSAANWRVAAQNLKQASSVIAPDNAAIGDTVTQFVEELAHLSRDALGWSTRLD